MDNKNILILNGSPRKNGTSYSFARTISSLAAEMGSTSEIINIIEYFEGNKNFEHLKMKISESDIIILSAPLYVDCLPQPVIWLFEKLYLEIKSGLKGKYFFSVGQCAFPYTEVLEPIAGSCSCFAEAMKMEYLGGLSYGGGVIINGRYLENLGKKGVKITNAFKFALVDILLGEKITKKPQEMLENRIPKLLSRPMVLLLNHMNKSAGRKNGVKDLKRKYYLEESNQ